MLVLKGVSGTPRQNASDVKGRRLRPLRRRRAKPRQRTPPRSPARGHAAKNIPKFFAIARDVTNPCGTLLAPQHAIAATPVAWPWSERGIVNASGCCAIVKWAASSVAWNTRPHEPSVVAGAAFSTAQRADVFRP